MITIYCMYFLGSLYRMYFIGSLFMGCTSGRYYCAVSTNT